MSVAQENTGSTSAGPRPSRGAGKPLTGAGRAGLLLGSLVALAGLFHGFYWQPQPADPFAPPEDGLMAWLSPVPEGDLAQMAFRPLAPPGTGWAPRSWAPDQHAQWAENPPRVRIDPEGKGEGRSAIWADPGGALLGMDGRLYRDGQPPRETDESLSAATGVVIADGAGEFGDPSPPGVPILGVDFSPIGSRIVIVSGDGAMQVLDADSGVPFLMLNGHDWRMINARFSPEGDRIVTGSLDGTARVWDVASGALLVTLTKHGDAVYSAAFSPRGDRIVTASRDNTARVWDADSGELLLRLTGHGWAVYSAAFSPGGDHIVTASVDKTVRVWDADSGALLLTLTGHGDAVYGAAFSLGGDRIVTASRDNTARVWDADSGELLLTLTGHTDDVHDAHFSPEGDRIVTLSNDGTARIWDAESGALLRRLIGHGQSVNDAVFSPDGSRIVTGSADGTVRVWNAFQGARTAIRMDDGNLCWPMQDDWSCEEVLLPLSLARLEDMLSLSLARLARHNAALGGPLASMPPSIQGAAIMSYLLPATLPTLLDGSRIQTAILVPDGVIAAGTEGTLIASDRDSGEFRLLRDQVPGLNLTALRMEGDTLWVAGTRPRTRDGLVVAVRRIAGWFGHDMGREPATEVVVMRGTWVNIDTAIAFEEVGYAPARWAFAWSVPATMMLVLAGITLFRRGPRIRHGVTGAPVADRPIGWADNDVLELKPIARAVSRFIRNVETRPPLTIAVTGSWGTGKSSLMNLVQEDLRRFGTRPVWFNAWHHRQEEHLLAALLNAIKRQLVPPVYTFGGMGFRLRLLWLRLSSMHALGMVLVMLVIGAGVLWWNDTGQVGRFVDWFKGNIPQPAAPAPSGETGTGSAKAADPYEEWMVLLAKFLGWSVPVLLLLRKMVPFAINPAKLMGDLRARASVRDFRDKLDFRHDFATAFGEVCKVARTPRNPGVVILIDDLDRCPSGAVMSLMESMNYLVSSGDCIIILGMDREQIERAVGLGLKDIVDGLPERDLPHPPSLIRSGESEVKADGEKARIEARRDHARRYLEKLINIEVEIPCMQPGDAKAMMAPEVQAEVDVLPEIYKKSKKSLTFLLDGFQTFGLPVIFALAVGFAVSTTLEIRHPVNPVVPAVAEAPEQPAATVIEVPQPDKPDEEATAESPEQERVQVLTPTRLSTAQWEGVAPNIRAWWIGSALLVVLTAAWLMLRQLRRRTEIVEDSAVFADALRDVASDIHKVNPTPRAIRLFENRMRYIATREDTAANPRPPDLTDRLFRRWLPAGHFEPNAPPIDERSLVLLGAEQVIIGAGRAAPDWIVTAVSDDSRQSYQRRWT